jgi:hypothetical protein
MVAPQTEHLMAAEAPEAGAAFAPTVEVAASWASGAPQLGQNSSPAFTCVPHTGQATVEGVEAAVAPAALAPSADFAAPVAAALVAMGDPQLGQ